MAPPSFMLKPFITDSTGAILRTKNGKKLLRRCASTSPSNGAQCIKPKNHNKRERNPLHQVGGPEQATFQVWHSTTPPVPEHGHHAHASFYRQPNAIDPFTSSHSRCFDETASGKNDPGRPWLDAMAKDSGHLLAWQEAIFQEMPLSGAMSPAQEARRRGRQTPLPLDTWWRKVAEREISDTVPKAIEYGATDLVDIGVQLGRWTKQELTDARAAELGCWFYLVGKMARATSALERGATPSDDTVKDIGIYVKMIQRIRDAGSWPGEDLGDEDSSTPIDEEGQ